MATPSQTLLWSANIKIKQVEKQEKAIPRQNHETLVLSLSWYPTKNNSVSRSEELAQRPGGFWVVAPTCFYVAIDPICSQLYQYRCIWGIIGNPGSLVPQISDQSSRKAEGKGFGLHCTQF